MKSIKPLNLELQSPWCTARGILSRKFLFATSFFIFVFFTSLYLFFSPDLASQPWDSLAYGHAAEESGLKSVWGNHPLGHVTFLLISDFAKQLGYEGRALPLFQLVNGIVGGTIVAVFYAVLVSIIGIRQRYSLGLSLVLGATYSFWFFAGTAEIYHFAILSSLLTWFALIYEIVEKRRAIPVLSGILTGFSILFHQLAVVLIPAGLVLIFLSPGPQAASKNEKIKRMAVYLGITVVVTAVGYLLIGFIVTWSFSLLKVFGWMRGYFGDPTYGRYFSLEVLKTAWWTVTQAVLFSPHNPAEYIGHVVLLFLIAIMFLGLWLRQALDRRKQAVMLTSTLQCLITWSLSLWWEPQNPKFWLLTLVPWMVLLALSLEAVETTVRNNLRRFETLPGYFVTIMPVIIGMVMLSTNMKYVGTGPDSEEFPTAMNLWLEHSEPEDVLITAGDLIPQLRYWGMRPNTLFLYRALQEGRSSSDKFIGLRTEIHTALCTNRSVLISPAASEYISDSELSMVGVSREELSVYLEQTSRKGEILFWYHNLYDAKSVPVYVLRGCDGNFGR